MWLAVQASRLVPPEFISCSAHACCLSDCTTLILHAQKAGVSVVLYENSIVGAPESLRKLLGQDDINITSEVSTFSRPQAALADPNLTFTICRIHQGNAVVSSKWYQHLSWAFSHQSSHLANRATFLSNGAFLIKNSARG